VIHNFAIIIPSYNERNNLRKLLPKLAYKYPATPIIVVDDNSPDQTATYTEGLSKKYPQIQCIKRSHKLGRGSACLAGFKKFLTFKDCDYVLEMDADYSHDPDDIQFLLQQAGKKRIVIGSRYVKGSKIVNWPITRKILSRLSNFYARAILQLPISDYTNGFRLYPKNAIKKIISVGLKEKGYAMLSESAYILFKKGFIFIEVPTTFVNRKIGKSNTNLWQYLLSILSIIRVRASYA